MAKSFLERFKTFTAILFLLCVVLAVGGALTRAGAPGIINYQGRVQVNGGDFTGQGQFKFALVNAGGTTTFWGNDGTSTTGNEPTSAVSLPVNKGLYSVTLGDAQITNMTVIPSTVFNNQDVRLRIWFSDGTNGSQQLTPDQRITASGYAFVANVADTVADNGITTAKIADGAVTPQKTGNFSKARVTTAASSFLASGGNLTVPFTTVEANSGGMFSAAQPTRLTLPTTGTYLVTTQVSLSGNPNTDFVVQLRIVGNVFYGVRSAVSGSSGLSTATVTGTVTGNAGDYVEVYLNNASGTSMTFTGAVFSATQLP